MGHIVNIQVAYMKKYVDLVRDIYNPECQGGKPLLPVLGPSQPGIEPMTFSL